MRVYFLKFSMSDSTHYTKVDLQWVQSTYNTCYLWKRASSDKTSLQYKYLYNFKPKHNINIFSGFHVVEYYLIYIIFII